MIVAKSCDTSSLTCPRRKAACRLHNDLPPVRWIAWRYHWGCRDVCVGEAGENNRQQVHFKLNRTSILFCVRFIVLCLSAQSYFQFHSSSHRTLAVSSPVWEPTLFRALSHKVRACSMVLVSWCQAGPLSGLHQLNFTIRWQSSNASLRWGLLVWTCRKEDSLRACMYPSDKVAMTFSKYVILSNNLSYQAASLGLLQWVEYSFWTLNMQPYLMFEPYLFLVVVVDILVQWDS